jgi:hypothetical protein
MIQRIFLPPSAPTIHRRHFIPLSTSVTQECPVFNLTPVPTLHRNMMLYVKNEAVAAS